MDNTTPPPLPPVSTPKPANTFYHQAAKFSLWAPVIAIGVSIFSNAAKTGGDASTARLVALVVGLSTALIMFCGFIFGIIALFGIPKYGKAGILWRASFGILIFALLMLIAIPNFIQARNKALERSRQTHEQTAP